MPAAKKRKKSSRRAPAAKAAGKRRGRSKPKRRSRGGWGWRLLIFAALLLIAWVVYLDYLVVQKFEGGRWVIPAHVYTRSLELRAGATVSKTRLIQELKDLGYRERQRADAPGSYVDLPGAVMVHARAFTFWDGPRPPRVARVAFHGGVVRSIGDAGDAPLELLRLEPRLFGSIFPTRHEDRSLVRLAAVPRHLIEALLAMEDRSFYRHIGIDPRGLARATWVNLTEGGVVQGGSTLTQQLVKNFYLTQERTVRRKVTEMIMALLLELRYEKNEILEAYINEVYLGQAGNRAIHGFGLASVFYFGRPLNELGLHEAALLVGLAKGASFYNPRRQPERALKRRNLAIDKMRELGFVDAGVAARAKQRGLGVTEHGTISATGYPGYLDFVRRQLQRDYRPEDLRTGGLHIFTTLDLDIQRAVEQAVTERLRVIEQDRKLASGALQAAVMVIRIDNGEVVALLGDRRPRFAGFNRALDAERPVGSLIKPAVFLTALESGYTLASRLDDRPLRVAQRGAGEWRPQNYDREFHGDVRLVDALAHSHNVATARLGMQVGIEEVIDMLRRLGLSRYVEPYPSLLLGAVNMTPIEMAQMYLSFANGGFRAALRSTRSVLDRDRRPLARYPLTLEKAVAPGTAALMTFALQQVVERGTARGLRKQFGDALGLAGKTGTTDGFRDSWFAGYSGNYLTVAWVGRDDNKPAKLSGASGAMRIWADIMAELNLTPVKMPDSPELVYLEVDPQGRLATGCPGAEKLPFVRGTRPAERAPCAADAGPAASGGVRNWIKRFFTPEEERNK